MLFGVLHDDNYFCITCDGHVSPLDKLFIKKLPLGWFVLIKFKFCPVAYVMRYKKATDSQDTSFYRTVLKDAPIKRPY